MNYIILGGQKFEYNLTRNAKKNINISIKENGNINVSSPKRVTISEIERIIILKQEWILKSIKKVSSKIQLCNKYEFDAFSTIYYLGNKLKIICTPSNHNFLEILDDKIIFYIKKNYIDNIEYKNRIFNALLKDELEALTVDMLIKYLKSTSKEILSFKIREMKSHWGTCIPSKKEIILNFNLIHCPIDAIEYVVLHEVVHLIHPNHSRNFYNTVAKYMPDWNYRRRKLRDYIVS